LSDAAVKAPVGRVSILTRLGRGCVDFTPSNNEFVCYFQEGDLKGFIEGNLYNLSWYDFFEFIQLLNGWLSCALSESFGFKNDAQDGHKSATENKQFHCILKRALHSNNTRKAEKQRERERERTE